MSDAKWYVIYIGDTKRIPSVSSAFSSCHIQHTLWIPTQNALQQFRGKDVIKPKVLFPGYIFVKFKFGVAGVEDKILTLGGYFLKMPGAKRPAEIPEEFIHRMKEIEIEKGVEEVLGNTFDLKIGDIVEVVNGPFLSGVGPIKGIKKGKIKVEIDLMNRPVEVELDPRQCSKVSSNEKKTNNS